jgi:hypothetical protein
VLPLYVVNITGETHTTFPVKWDEKVGGVVEDRANIAANSLPENI